MKWKKSSGGILLGLLAFSLLACSSNTTTETNNSATEATYEISVVKMPVAPPPNFNDLNTSCGGHSLDDIASHIFEIEGKITSISNTGTLLNSITFELIRSLPGALGGAPYETPGESIVIHFDTNIANFDRLHLGKGSIVAVNFGQINNSKEWGSNISWLCIEKNGAFYLINCKRIGKPPQSRSLITMQQPLNMKSAIARSIALTGLDAFSSKPVATMATMVNDNTPFLATQFDGRSVWNVEFDGGSLKLKSMASWARDQYPRVFTVSIDSGNGQLLGIRCRCKGQDPDFGPEPSVVSAETQLRNSGEIYTGVPSTDPKLRFIDAVDMVLAKGFGSPLTTKEIDGKYVMYSAMGSAPRAVWIITLRGIPAIQPPGPMPSPIGSKPVPASPIPLWQRNHIRNIIDAMSGEWIFASTIPQPK